MTIQWFSVESKDIIATSRFSPVDEDVEAPDDAGDGDHVEGDGAAELPPLHPWHVKLLPLIEWLDLNIG